MTGESCGENSPAALEPAPTYLAVAAERRDDEIVVRLRGELDVSNVADLREAMRAILANPPSTVVVDAAGLEYVDCAGLSVLVSARQQLARQGRKLTIVDPQPLVRRRLTITGWTTLQGGRRDG